MFLCPNDHAINFDSIVQNYEQAIFNSPNKLPNGCKQKILHSLPTVWHKLSGENAWIFAVCNETITIPCDNEIQPTRLYLNSSGKISLNEKCKIYTKNSKLSPTRKYQSKILIDLYPNVTLDYINNTQKSRKLVNVINEKTHYNFNSLAKDADDLKTIQEKIKLELEKDNNTNDNTLITTIIIIITVMLSLSMILCIILLYKRITNSKCKPEGNESPSSSQTIELTTPTLHNASEIKGNRAKCPLPEIK